MAVEGARREERRPRGKKYQEEPAGSQPEGRGRAAPARAGLPPPPGPGTRASPGQGGRRSRDTFTNSPRLRGCCHPAPPSRASPAAPRAPPGVPCPGLFPLPQPSLQARVPFPRPGLRVPAQGPRSRPEAPRPAPSRRARPLPFPHGLRPLTSWAAAAALAGLRARRGAGARRRAGARWRPRRSGVERLLVAGCARRVASGAPRFSKDVVIGKPRVSNTMSPGGPVFSLC